MDMMSRLNPRDLTINARLPPNHKQLDYTHHSVVSNGDDSRDRDSRRVINTASSRSNSPMPRSKSSYHNNNVNMNCMRDEWRNNHVSHSGSNGSGGSTDSKDEKRGRIARRDSHRDKDFVRGRERERSIDLTSMVGSGWNERNNSYTETVNGTGSLTLHDNDRRLVPYSNNQSHSNQVGQSMHHHNNVHSNSHMATLSSHTNSSRDRNDIRRDVSYEGRTEPRNEYNYRLEPRSEPRTDSRMDPKSDPSLGTPPGSVHVLGLAPGLGQGLGQGQGHGNTVTPRQDRERGRIQTDPRGLLRNTHLVRLN